MFLNLFYFILLSAVSFGVSTPFFAYTAKNTYTKYTFSRDPWIYIWALSLILTTATYFFTPDFNDTIANISYTRILITFVLSAFIYMAHLFETEKLEYLIIAASSAFIAYLIPNDTLIFEGNLPLFTERLIIFCIIFFITFFAKVLNGMSAIFAIFMLTGLFGICLVSLIAGLPLAFGFVAATLSGIWLGFIRYNWYPSEIALNDGACTSAGFLLSNFFLFASQEFAGPSMCILCTYLIAETLLVLTRRYILRIKEPDFYNNSAYFLSYTKDIDIDAILVAIYKIGAINIIFAGFQIYAPNAFSLPVFSLVINLWLLNMMYNASEKTLSIKQTKNALVQDVKDGIQNIKNSLTKDKK